MSTSAANIATSEREHVCAFVALLEDGLTRMDTPWRGLETSLLQIQAARNQALGTLRTTWEASLPKFLWRQSTPVVSKASETALDKFLLVKSNFMLGFDFDDAMHIAVARSYKEAFDNSYERIEDLRAGWGCRNRSNRRNASGKQNRGRVPTKGSASTALQQALASVQYMCYHEEHQNAGV